MNQKKEPHPDPCNYVNFKRAERAEGTIPCPDCQQPPASEFTSIFRKFLSYPDTTLNPRDPIQWEDMCYQACDIIDRAVASNKNILTACEKVDEWLQKNVPATKRPAWLDKLLIDAIAQSKQSVTPEAHKEKKHGGYWPEAKKE